MPLQRQLELGRRLFDLDRAEQTPGVELPHALERKYPNAGKEWPWFWVFPALHHSCDPRSGVIRRHHIYEKLQRSIKRAVRAPAFKPRTSVHTLRHCFATHLLDNGYDIRTVQELWDTRMCATTMIYTHVLNKGGKGVRSPLD